MQRLRGRAAGAALHGPSLSKSSAYLGVFSSQTKRGLASAAAQKSASQSSVPSSSELPREADVVVVGGGAVGSSTLYHLAKMGVKNAILLDKHEATSGTTWHSAGLVWRLRSTDVEIELIDHTRELATKTLEEETGLSSGWAPNGGLFPASTPQRFD